ncbi:hypothetical protein [Streptomyces pseudovenezuelae]|uniref:WD40 repeat protein n=1 Tax=Streptomyces pseudovenezuelae TaxID=67350 RepID=A0ABT6LAA0_9ACTN|nr:hypothetical protein [Streptomyces pseudovenezuelae]MDH6213241.1 WD40 repeat protein [Streptomyces pseudovenezuelae]
MGRREKPLDPGDGVVQRFAYELRKLRDEANSPTYRAMALRAGYSAPTLSAAAGGERLPSPPVLLAYVTACDGDPVEWELRLREAVAEAADARATDDTEAEDSPYPGLARFETGEGEHFHGRDDLIAELLRLTGRSRFAAVVGASGSGKSSLLRAGLIPALREPGGAVPGERAGVAPGEHAGGVPGEHEGVAFRPAAIRLLTPGPHPARTHEALFTPHDSPGDTLLVVDQFEEVFTLCAGSAERARFLGQLLRAADPTSRLRVLLAVRADFYGRCAEHGPLAEALRDATLLAGPMTARGLREAVVRPAAACRLVVERALTARIVADVADEPGGLPLMAHALREVWRRRTGKTLTLAAYEAVGGVHGAVAHTAEETYARCTPAEAAAVRALLLRLVNPGEGTEDTRRPARRAELDADETTAHVLEHLVRARLLTVDGDTVDLAHEALIGAWPRLRAWIDEDRERLRLHRRLTEAAGAWTELGRDAGALYRGIRLSEAREAFGDGNEEGRGACGGEGGPRTRELNPLERDFLAASVSAYEHGVRSTTRAARRLRALTGALAVLLCLAVVAGVAAWRQNGVSSRQRDEAEARRVAAQADTLRATEPRTAMRLALAAWRTADLPETRQALRTAAAQSEQDEFTQPEEGGRALNAPVWLSRDGRILSTVVHDKVVQWDVPSHRQLRSVSRHGLSANVVDVSPDGRLVAYRDPGGHGVLIGGLTDGSTRRLGTGAWESSDGGFGPSGHTFFQRRPGRGTAAGRATLEMWDVRTGRALLRYDRGDDDGGLPVQSPDERYIAWCTDYDGQLRVVDAVRRRPVTTPVPAATERALCRGDQLVFSSDSRAVATTASDGIVTWDLRTGRERPRLPLDGAANAVEFVGPYALTWSSGSLALWRTDLPAPTDDSPREPLLTLPVASSSVGSIRLDTEAGVLRYQEGGRTSVVRTFSLQGLIGGTWREKAATVAAFDRRGRPVRPVAVKDSAPVVVDPTGRTALTEEGTLVDVTTGKRRTGDGGVKGEDLLTAGAFSPDGRYLAVADFQDRVTLWDVHDWRRLAVLKSVGSTRHKAALAFSADGSLLVAGAPDGSAKVWETATPALPAATLPAGDGPILAVGLTPDGSQVRIATPHLPDRARALAPNRAAATVCERAEGGLSRAEWDRYFPSAEFQDTCGA